MTTAQNQERVKKLESLLAKVESRRVPFEEWHTGAPVVRAPEVVRAAEMVQPVAPVVAMPVEAPKSATTPKPVEVHAPIVETRAAEPAVAPVSAEAPFQLKPAVKEAPVEARPVEPTASALPAQVRDLKPVEEELPTIVQSRESIGEAIRLAKTPEGREPAKAAPAPAAAAPKVAEAVPAKAPEKAAVEKVAASAPRAATPPAKERSVLFLVALVVIGGLIAASVVKLFIMR